jgi:hypothetical protein
MPVLMAGGFSNDMEFEYQEEEDKQPLQIQ